MQAVPLRPRGWSGTARWLLHSAVVGSFIPLFIVLSRVDPVGLAAPTLVRTLQDSLPLVDWLPARNPARTVAPRDPSPPLRALFGLPPTTALPPAALAPRTGLPAHARVQTHREAALFAGPGEQAQRFTVLPEWSYLRVLDSAPGWLFVYYEGDGKRQAGQAWIPDGAVGPIGGPRWLTTLRETPLYAGPERDAPAYTRLPAWSLLESLDRDEAERSLVYYPGDGDTRRAGQAWAGRADLDVARAPDGSRLPWGAVPGSDGDAARLAVPYRTQLDGSRAAGANCGPSAVGMALESFGLAIPTADLRALADRLQRNWDPDNGVPIEVLAELVEHHDRRALDLERPGGGFRRWNIEDVRHHLRAGHPVIPQLRYRLLPGKEWYPVGYDHYVVLTGFSGDTFYYNDPIPVAGRGHDLPISAEALLRAWRSSSEPLAAVAVTR